MSASILVVEDNPDNMKLINWVMEDEGYALTCVGSAEEALDEGNPFDVILMDIQMPVMDGYQATRLLRRKGYAGPIIALTAHSMSGAREKCIQAGCDGYATKPLNRAKLIEIIRTFAASTPDPVCRGASLQT